MDARVVRQEWFRMGFRISGGGGWLRRAEAGLQTYIVDIAEAIDESQSER
jgi:hypothetical protein